jgi:hypothetical protein
MMNNPKLTKPLAPSDELKKLLQIPESGRAILPVLVIVRGLVIQHPVLETLLNTNETSLTDVISALQQETTDKNALPQLTNARGLCSENPVYALLIECSLSFPMLPRTAWSIVAVVLEFIFRNRTQFDEYPHRLVEMSKAIRQLMIAREPIVLLGSDMYTSYVHLTRAMEVLSSHPQLNSADQRYAKYIETTLSGNWKHVTRSIGRPRKNSGGHRRKRTAGRETIASTDESDVTMIGLPEVITADGILSLPETLEPSVFLEVRPDIQSGRNRLTLDVIEDPGIRRVHAINTTHRLVQANNKSLLSISILQPDELALLLNALIHRSGESSVEVNCQLAIMLMLWSGVSLELLLSWQFCGDAAGLVQHGEHWYTQCIIEPVLMNDSRKKIILSCPTAIAKLALALNTERKHKKLFTFSEQINPLQEIKSWLARLSKRHSVNISVDGVQHFLANRLQCEPALDPVYQRLAFGVERFQYRVQRYYTQMSGEQIAHGISSIWKHINLQIEEAGSLEPGFYQIHALDNDAVYGSERAGSRSQHLSLVSGLIERCKAFSRQQVERNISALTQYHNCYVEYTALMLLSGTGCRAVRNPFPSLALVIDSLLFVCDKDDSSVATRLVTLCALVQQQITFYRQHLDALASRIAAIAPEIAMHNQQVQSVGSSDLAMIEQLIKMKNAVGPLFYLNDAGVTKQLNPASLILRTRPSGLEVNFGRHYLRSELIRLGVHNELINQILGHWSLGESPFSQCSEFSPYDSSRVLQPVLSAIMEAQGWKPLRSLLT